jgi:heme exporter protein D
MAELGKYAGVVLSAYGVTLVLLLGLVVLSLWQGGRIKRALREQERRMGRHG